MRTRRLLAAGAFALLGAFVTRIAGVHGPTSPAEAPVAPFAVRPAPGAFGDASVPDLPPDAPAWQRRFAAGVAEVHASCGLPVHTRCDAAGCAAVVAAPDLDAFGGWLRLLTRSPRFVLQTAARDLGLPTGLLTCGQALTALSADGSTASVELPDGTEIWCLPTDPTGRTSWDEDQRRLCARAAAEHAGTEVPGFDAPSLRRLRFHRGGEPPP